MTREELELIDQHAIATYLGYYSAPDMWNDLYLWFDAYGYLGKTPHRAAVDYLYKTTTYRNSEQLYDDDAIMAMLDEGGTVLSELDAIEVFEWLEKRHTLEGA